MTIARILGMALAAAAAQPAVMADSGPCTPSPDGFTITCSGDLVSGIVSGRDFASPPVYQVTITGVTTTIAPPSGNAIHFRNASGGDVRIDVESGPVPVTIRTTAAGARGLHAESLGTPPDPPDSARDPFLGVFLLDDPDDPDAPTGNVIAGGRVDIESHADIKTTGAGAHGLSVVSSSTGYGDKVTGLYDTFDPARFTWVVTDVRQPGDSGEAGELGTSLAGVLIDEAGNVLLDDDGKPRTAGTFTLRADGTFEFEPDTTLEGLQLAEDEVVLVAVDYTLAGTDASTQATQQESARLVVTYRGAADGGVEQLRESHFPRYGVSDWPGNRAPSADPDEPAWVPSLFPDLQRFIARQAAIAEAGSRGGSVYVTHAGVIETTGLGAQGIHAETNGANGAAGRNGSMFRSATVGLPGQDGGSVTVTANGRIVTGANEAIGVLAMSRGGDGGHGGEGGTWRYGQRGGDGADAGDVDVLGDGDLHTTGDSAIGILAFSVGGNGGGGGSGSFVTGGATGGFGGQAGTVTVAGQWDITTLGLNAHAIWAKAVGGNAGGGGSGGWLWGDNAGGGQASDGGSVFVRSGGALDSTGKEAYGILAQSIGGFGGSGGGGFSLFYSAGGNGSSAGSGSDVTVEQAGTGSIVTRGVGAHGILAQSIGGGGGSGGGTSGFIAAGGDAGAGGHGGTVVVSNAGSITTGNVGAYGILAESIGGGGGDGGAAKGAGGVGGAGSGGGRGAAVTVTNAATGTITASGAQSIGIMAQSIGGGGGNGGSTGGIVAIGGSGSATSNGGTVTLANAGTILSTSYGLFAQSVGGGGGNGGSSTGWFSFGGTAGGGGAAAAVTLGNSGSITTREDNASAIFAQSVGGGGGSGGNAIAVGTLVSLAIGGKGGLGGAGDVVTVRSDGGTLTTRGDSSSGIVAQSIGGGGGSGGYAFAGAISPGLAVTVALGGKAGGGGDGKDVILGSHSDIDTQGYDAHGILAQSVGGGGGRGGFSIAFSGSDGLGVAFGMGGTGGRGGSAGAVTLGSAEDALTGTIKTDGRHSYGILAQSVGGGGGDGGFSVAATASGGIGASLSFGGSAGVGGIGRDVKVWSANSIETLQADSHGVFAQSVGGGGGSGGFSATGGLSGSAQVGVSFGGAGGGGGAAGSVDVVTSGATIKTGGTHSYGVLAQSIGGSGGDGGFSVAGGISGSASVNFAMGGSGGSGAVARGVTLSNASSVTTVGSDSHGLFAQSVGGGGGSGGFSVTGGISASSAQIGASIGGAGGGGSQSGHVQLTTTGAEVKTTGDRSYGVLAQSIGGSGGDGGFSVAGGISASPSVNFAMGGGGGTASTGGEVDLVSSSSVSTGGRAAHGLFAQSVGGGGGSGGFAIAGGLSASSVQVAVTLGGPGGAGGSASAVDLTSTGLTVTTLGERAFGLLAQSVGGGGGDGGFSIAGGMGAQGSVEFAMGGRGGVAGVGGAVTLTNASAITTRGSAAHGIVAQSIGGGGGSGGFGLTGSLAVGPQSRQVSVSVGGTGGAGGNAGAVTATHDGSVETFGERAYGVLVQSVGGGGGDGGYARVLNALEESEAPDLPVDPDDPDKDEPKSVSFGITVGVGGNGAKAGAGSTARLVSTGDVTTHGAGSHALFVQSVGGGGGIGGFSATDGSGGNGEIGIEIGFSLGGKGGLGGAAGLVDVTSGGKLVTLGAGAHGIVAQSIGGGGGAGGASVSASKAPGEDAKVAVNVNASIGGSGGVAGDGGIVTVKNTGSIDTSGANAYGVFAQSVGGGGGDGGHSLVAIGDAGDEDDDGESSLPFDLPADGDDPPPPETWSVGLTIGAGGVGGAAGIGNTVTLDNSGQVVTRGTGSHALFAQSVGGGGGVGGTTAARGSGGSGNVAIQFGFALGGSGGGGGSASLVKVSNAGTLLTLGDEAHGIVAQSVGGGGGAAGGALSSGSSESADEQVSINLNIAIGGSGALAGHGGGVDVDNTGWIETAGRGAYGVLAQSIGGGGGHGGLSTALAGGSDESLVNLGIGVGGGGGGGGHGGDVDVTSSGRLITAGAESIGIYAQSVGGGGGTGGTAIVQGGGARWGAVDVGVGGSGGSGNYGGQVTVTNSGDLDTFGFASHGIFAQSVGGGGGRGGLTQTVNTSDDASDASDGGSGLKLGVSVGGRGAGASDGGVVTVHNQGLIHTRGAGAYGVLAQSVGGGGGEGGYGGYAGDGDAAQDEPFELPSLELQVTLGGSAGSGGRGGNVAFGGTGGVLTEGRGAVGVLAQSIGGGGGLGGFGLAASTSSIALGGAGGAGGAGGKVDVTLDGWIETFGDSAYAILAQSIGGGGGAAGDVAAGLSPTGGFGLGLAFGRAGGGGGDGGAVTVTTSGDIYTHGAGAIGIFAQSVGGGGGLGGRAAGLLPFAGSVGGAGAGGRVIVRHSGDILTEGVGAHGIVAQSAGGTLRGAAVDVTVGGTIATFGNDASGVLLQSIGGAGGDTLRLELEAGGRIYGGGGVGAGVTFLDGSDNQFVNHGIVGSVHGLDGLAIVGGAGNETVRNQGTVFGLVRLGGGSNVFENLAGGVLAPGATIDLGVDGVLLNAGILSPGGAGVFMTSRIVGDLVSSATAEHWFEIDMTHRLADGLVVTGDFTAAGTVNLAFVGPITARNQAYTLVSSEGRVLGDALQLGSHALPAAMTVNLAFRDGAAWLDLAPDFSLSGLTLNGNLGAVGRHLNAVIDKGPGAAMQSFLDGVMLFAADEAVNALLDQLQPTSFAALPTASTTAQLRFNDALLSCRSLDGEQRYNGESDCAWVRVAAWDYDQDETAAAHGYEQRAFEVSTGVQKGVGEGERWYVGMGVSVEDSSTDAGPLTESNGSLVQVGGVLKGVFGPASLALSASGGAGSYDTRRRVPYLGEFVVARSEQDLTLYSADLRVAYDFAGARGYLRPMLDVNYANIRLDGFRERGAGVVNLVVDESSDDYVALRPALEAGWEWQLEGGSVLRPFTRVGMTEVLEGETRTVTARFDGTPAGVAPFVSEVAGEDTYTDVVVGFDWLRAKGPSVRFGYFGQFSSETDLGSVSLKVWMPF